MAEREDLKPAGHDFYIEQECAHLGMISISDTECQCAGCLQKMDRIYITVNIVEDATRGISWPAIVGQLPISSWTVIEIAPEVELSSHLYYFLAARGNAGMSVEFGKPISDAMASTLLGRSAEECVSIGVGRWQGMISAFADFVGIRTFAKGQVS